MGTFRGTCEIVEVKEEMNLKQQSIGRPYGQNPETSVNERDRNPPVLKLKCKESLEDDINQLFASLSIRTSTKSLDSMHRAGKAPVSKNNLKKPITVGMPNSPALGNTEPVTLKQALRDLCLSKASEMAANRRLLKSKPSLGVSEAGRIKTLYNSVVVEARKSGPSTDNSKDNMVKISLVPEKGKFNTSQDIPGSQIPKVNSLSQSAHSSAPGALQTKQDVVSTSTVQNNITFSSNMIENQTCKLDPVHKDGQTSVPAMSSSKRTKTNVSLDENRRGVVDLSLEPEEFRLISTEKMDHPVHVTKLNSSNSSAHFSSRPGMINRQDCVESIMKQSSIFSAPGEVASNCTVYSSLHLSAAPMQGDILSASKRVGNNQRARSSPQFGAAGNHIVQNENISASKKVVAQTLNLELEKKGKHTPAVVLSSKSSGGISEQVENGPVPKRLGKKELQVKAVQKGKLQSASSKRSASGNRVSKLARNTHNSVKPVIRNRSVIKKKLKWRSTSSVYVDDTEDDIYSSMDNKSQLVCQRCQCALKNMSNESRQDSPEFSCVGPSAEVISTDINPGLSKQTSKGYSTVVKGKDLDSKEKGEFSQSSGSLGEYSSTTSTGISDDSSASGVTYGNKPHMSKDVRWGAIHNFRMQHGVLDLRHFSLLKKLGSGDIGTVYLAELIGTNCLFAIKVMDNEFLARRNKLPRAQTEGEILRMLDHPFLPTLYAQFMSDDLSCLVMEYCPGGDLHVLRQRQPTKCFSEPAARFYAAEVLLALEYLHMLGIVYRDLKPENILVREDGHIMLTDFDLSLRCDVSPTLLKSSLSNMDPARISGPHTSSGCIQPFCAESSAQVSCFSPRFLPAASRTRKLKADLAAHFKSLPQLVAEPTNARSNSFVGTHEYLAPEIIKGEGHGAAVDWWTFGVLLYELLYGKTPFKGSVNEETVVNVVLKSLKFPDMPFVSFQARDLIRGLLAKDPRNRLGSSKGAAEIKQHPFFEGLNWALIRCATPPELPECYDFRRLQECKATGDHLEFELF